MKRKWKWILGIGLLVVIAGGTFAAIRMKNNGIVTVQTGRSVRQDLTSLVTASGEIKPLKYINIGANVMGRITDINVKEGDRVHKNQVLAKLESVQAEADVAAQNAALNSSLAEAAASEAGLKAMDENLRTAQASVDRSVAELERAKLDYERAGQLWKEKLIAKQEYDRNGTPAVLRYSLIITISPWLSSITSTFRISSGCLLSPLFFSDVIPAYVLTGSIKF